MKKQTATKVLSPDRAATFKVIAGRIRLIGSRRSPTLKSVYNEAATIIEKQLKKHASTTKN